MQLRNPWGKFEWNGYWSDASSLWTFELKESVGWSNADDGTFWMCYDDFRQYFKWVQVCKLNDEYNYSFTECQQKPFDDYNLQKLLVTEDGPITISVAQKDKRCMERDSGYDYKFCRLIVMKVGSEIKDCNFTYVDGIKGKKRELHLEIEWLEAGQYLVFVEFDWPVKDQVTPSE